MSLIYDRQYFENMSTREIEEWIIENKKELVGSAIFTANNSFTSKIVRWAENWGNKNKKEFTPSHTGSIVKENSEIVVFDMKPIRAKTTPLLDYLIFTNDDFVIIINDFKLNKKIFSNDILEYVGRFYPYMSAVRSIFNKRNTKWARHCSEIHLRALQKQDIYSGINPEITPEELWHLMID